MRPQPPTTRHAACLELATQFFRLRLWTRKELLVQLFEQNDRQDEDLKAELPLKCVWMVAAQEEQAGKSQPWRYASHDAILTIHRHRLLGRRNTECQPEGLARLSGAGRSAGRGSAADPSPRKYWARRGIAEWLADDVPTLVGIDHGSSFPLRYFEVHHLPPDWDEFLDDFQHHWPTDAEHMYVSFIRDGVRGDGAARMGDPRWRRLCKERCRAKSVFHFDVQGHAATSTHAGIPWLRTLRGKIARRISTTSIRWRRGCARRIGMAGWRRHLRPH